MASNADTLIIDDFTLYNEENPLIIGEEYTEVYFNGTGNIEIEQLDASNDGLLVTIAQGANVTLNNFSVSEEAITLNCEGSFNIRNSPTVIIRLTEYHFEKDALPDELHIPLFKSDDHDLIFSLVAPYERETFVLEDGTVFEPWYRKCKYNAFYPEYRNQKHEFGVIVNLRQSIVPEPTTATLSLLALAGLAARRRRK